MRELQNANDEKNAILKYTNHQSYTTATTNKWTVEAYADAPVTETTNFLQINVIHFDKN